MSWIQTAYLIAEVIAIPLTGLLTRVLDHALAVRRRGVAVHARHRSPAPPARAFTSLIAWRVVQGFAGGTLIPAVFSAVFLLFPVAPADAGDHDRRRARGACPDRRTGGRRLDHRDLFLALAVPDQRRCRALSRRSWRCLSLPQERPRFAEARRLDVAVAGCWSRPRWPRSRSPSRRRRQRGWTSPLAAGLCSP